MVPETKVPSWFAIGASAVGGALVAIVAAFAFGDTRIWVSKAEGAQLREDVLKTAIKLNDATEIIERVNSEQARRTGILAEIQTNQISMLGALKAIQERANMNSESMIQVQSNVGYLNETLKELKAEMRADKNK